MLSQQMQTVIPHQLREQEVSATSFSIRLYICVHIVLVISRLYQSHRLRAHVILYFPLRNIATIAIFSWLFIDFPRLNAYFTHIIQATRIIYEFLAAYFKAYTGGKSIFRQILRGSYVHIDEHY